MNGMPPGVKAQSGGQSDGPPGAQVAKLLEKLDVQMTYSEFKKYSKAPQGHKRVNIR